MVARGNKGKDTSKSGTATEVVSYLSILDKPLRCAGHGAPPNARIVRGAKIDFSIQRVAALLVSEKGQPRWQVALSDVQSLGGDEVNIFSWDCLKPLDYEGGRNVFGKSGGVIGAKAISEQREYGGRIGTFWFRAVDGIITRYDLSLGGVKGLLKGRRVVTRDQVVSASPDRIVVVAESLVS